jgi:fumarylacetoacetate (FAA) hydrolase
MRLITFRDPKHRLSLRVGLLHASDPHCVVDLAATFGTAAPEWTKSVQRLIETCAEGPGRDQEIRETCRKLAEASPSTLGSAALRRETLHLESPLPRPVSMRDGYAFRQHVETARRNRGLPMIPEFDAFPVFYFTNALAVTGPGEVRVHRAAQDKLDFELEMAFVVGRPIRNATVQEADQAIFGLLVMNDWSARTLQMEEMKLNLGPAKGKDFATSLGPYLVTLDDPSLARATRHTDAGRVFDLPMRAWVNGRQLSEGNVKDMRWTCAEILARVAQGVDVVPGEVIGSGTVGTGCLLELNGSKITDNLWLKPGDTVELEIEGLGRLVNRVIDDETAAR